MSNITPGSLLGAPKLQLFDNDGNPAAGYFLFTYIAGTSTPLETYSDSLLTTPNADPVELDAYGRATVFLQPGIAYKFVLTDPDNTLIWTEDDVVDLGSLLFGYVVSTDGSKGVTSGYTITSDDILVTVNSTPTNPTIINLPSAAEWFKPIRIKNIGSNPISVVAAGTDTIEGSTLTSIGIPAASSPLFPTITLLSDGSGIWWVVESLGGVVSGGGTGGNGAGTVFVKQFPLTDAQIKALPTTALTVIAAPPTGYTIKVLGASIYVNTTAGAYTNINATYCAAFQLTFNVASAAWEVAPVINDNTTTTPLTQVNALLGAAAEKRHTLVAANFFAPAAVGADLWVTDNDTPLMSAIEAQPLVVSIDNNGSGNLTGGNAANTGLLVVTYTLEPVRS